MLPKNLLAHVSPFFHACLNGDWSKTVANDIRLLEDKPAVFEWFIRWLYLWTTTAVDECEWLIPNNFDPMMSLDAWVLGDKLGCPQFQDFALAPLFYYNVSDSSLFDFAGQVYAASPPGSSIGRWIARDLLAEAEGNPSKHSELVVLAEEISELAVDIVRVMPLLRKERDLTPFMMASASREFIVHRTSVGWDASDGGWNT